MGLLLIQSELVLPSNARQTRLKPTSCTAAAYNAIEAKLELTGFVVVFLPVPGRRLLALDKAGRIQ